MTKTEYLALPLAEQNQLFEDDPEEIIDIMRDKEPDIKTMTRHEYKCLSLAKQNEIYCKYPAEVERIISAKQI